MIDEWIEIFHKKKSAGKVNIRSSFFVHNSKDIEDELALTLNLKEKEIEKLNI